MSRQAKPHITLTPERLTELYTALLLLFQPLLLHNGYFDVTATKTWCYVTLTGFYILSLALCLFMRRQKPQIKWRAGLFAAFALVLILSSLLPGAPEGAWLGRENRSQGIMLFSLYALSGVGLCAYGRFGKTVRLSALTGFGAVSLLAVLNVLGLDVFGYISRLEGADINRFMSTIGNVDLLGAYCVLLLPVCVMLCLSAEKPLRLVPLCILGLWALLACAGEGAVVGLGAAVLFLPVLLKNDPRALRRWGLVFPLGLAAGGLYRLCALRLSALAALLLRPAPALVPAIFGLALWLILRKKDNAALLRFRQRYCAVLLLLLLFIIVFLLLANTLLCGRLGEGIEEYTVLDADWGSDRGAIWQSCLELFASFSPLRRLIGGGAGCLAAWDRAHRLFPDAIVDAAHNEYLHYLLTGGILGLVCYLAFLTLSFREGMNTRAGCAVLAGCFGYAVQAAANIAQPVTTPLFFALLFVCGGEAADEPPLKKHSAVLIALCTASALLFGAVCGRPSPHDRVPEQLTGTVITSRPAPLYAAPDGNVVLSVPGGTVMSYVNSHDGWTQVFYQGSFYFVKKEFVDSFRFPGPG